MPSTSTPATARQRKASAADLLSAVRGAHVAGASCVAIRGAGSAAGGGQHALASAEKAVASRRRPVAAAGRPKQARRLPLGRRPRWLCLLPGRERKRPPSASDDE